jgi:hypothetical protein
MSHCRDHAPNQLDLTLVNENSGAEILAWQNSFVRIPTLCSLKTMDALSI